MVALPIDGLLVSPQTYTEMVMDEFAKDVKEYTSKEAMDEMMDYVTEDFAR